MFRAVLQLLAASLLSTAAAVDIVVDGPDQVALYVDLVEADSVTIISDNSTHGVTNVSFPSLKRVSNGITVVALGSGAVVGHVEFPELAQVGVLNVYAAAANARVVRVSAPRLATADQIAIGGIRGNVHRGRVEGVAIATDAITSLSIESKLVVNGAIGSFVDSLVIGTTNSPVTPPPPSPLCFLGRRWLAVSHHTFSAGTTGVLMGISDRVDGSDGRRCGLSNRWQRHSRSNCALGWDHERGRRQGTYLLLHPPGCAPTMGCHTLYGTL